MVVDLSKPKFEAEMSPREMKLIRIKMGLTPLQLGRAFGFTTSDSICAQSIYRYESETTKHDIPPWLARLLRMFETHGIPDGWLDKKQPISEGESE